MKLPNQIAEHRKIDPETTDKRLHAFRDRLARTNRECNREWVAPIDGQGEFKVSATVFKRTTDCSKFVTKRSMD